MNFKKGKEVVMILHGGGCKTAEVRIIESVKKGKVRLCGDEHTDYDATTGQQIDPIIPGFFAELIPLALLGLCEGCQAKLSS